MIALAQPDQRPAPDRARGRCALLLAERLPADHRPGQRLAQALPFPFAEELEMPAGHRLVAHAEIELGRHRGPGIDMGRQELGAARQGVDEGTLARLDLPDDGDARGDRLQLFQQLDHLPRERRADELQQLGAASGDLVDGVAQRAADLETVGKLAAPDRRARPRRFPEPRSAVANIGSQPLEETDGIVTHSNPWQERRIPKRCSGRTNGPALFSYMQGRKAYRC